MLLLAAYPIVGGAWSSSAVLFGGLSGVSGALAISLLYACLAIGPMSILSPVTAVVSAIVPAAIGIFVAHDQFGTLGYVALGLALVAVVLVGFVRDQRAVRPTLRGLTMAVLSGIFIGLFLVLINLTPQNSGLVPLIANRGVNAIIMFATVGILAAGSRGRAIGASPQRPAGLAARHPSRHRLRTRGCHGQLRPAARHPARRPDRHGRAHRPVSGRDDHPRGDHPEGAHRRRAVHRARPRHRRRARSWPSTNETGGLR